MLYEKQQQQGEKRREEEKKVLKRSQMSNNKNGSWRRDRKQISGSCKKIILCTSSSTQSEYDRELSQKNVKKYSRDLHIVQKKENDKQYCSKNCYSKSILWHWNPFAKLLTL